ncbi:hypothetical protein [Devosia sp. MC521]|uniref:MGH1-like glycoside hydrolase domain-containing protein n=1 Tax=Devosia sp. MC521 TaxID=2759954 RepID=UPI0015FDF745|nr:hypothetical protein [Devosia sp. MC521]MBJ6986426.1 hypothetical protein [Devosia sp. MC521]QMW64104.1 hypothetical protein H4N61_07305 [Devosia sp. MC521]
MSLSLLETLRASPLADRLGPLPRAEHQQLLEEWQKSGVNFVSSSERLNARYEQAVRELFDCIGPAADDTPILHEGGIYHGCWLESTGTINAEILSRFLPSIAQATFSAFARHQRDDGLFPYKMTAATGPKFSQIQLVSPLARSVWTHARLNKTDTEWLRTIYEAMARYDSWIAQYRDTRGTGGVEAFSTYDTGHDLSSRFWHVDDSPFQNDPTRFDPDSPILPFVAPDLTANIASQRHYLGAIAATLGENADAWASKAAASTDALFRECFDDEDALFYDKDRNDRHVRIQSDVLLRVLACEIGDGDLFRTSLKRYLLNTRKFFARFPLTSIALDDPRFDPNPGQNSWNGPTNFLTLIRTPHAFEHHGHHTELTWIMQPVLDALIHAERFPQTLNPYTGAAGFTEKYSPAILCLLDFLERTCGIAPRPDGSVWFTSLLPKPTMHQHQTWDTAYSRVIDGVTYELINLAQGSEIYRNGALHVRTPAGLRVCLDRSGALLSVIGVTARTVVGTIWYRGAEIAINAAANQELAFEGAAFNTTRDPGMVLPQYD